jgi:hypothetical protein
VDLRPHARLHLDQRGLSQLTPSRLDRREGAADHFPQAFLDALATRIRDIQPAGAATLVAIDGRGCGGKTALAEGLLDRLEPQVQYVSTDEFFAGFGRADPGPVPHLRWAELRSALEGLRREGRTEARGFDWPGDRILPPERLEGRAWLVDGLFSLHAELRPLYDLTIWVQGALESRMDRVVARDGAHMVPFWEREWVPREVGYMRAERPWLTADLVVAGAELDIGALGTSLRSCV